MPNPPAAIEAVVQFNELELSKWDNTKHPFQNLSEKERDNIIIKPIDDCSAVVMMDVSDYLQWRVSTSWKIEIFTDQLTLTSHWI